MIKPIGQTTLDSLFSILSDHPDGEQSFLGELLFNGVESDVAEKTCDFLDKWYGLVDIDQEFGDEVNWSTSEYTLKNVAKEIMARPTPVVMKALQTQLDKREAKLVYTVLTGYVMR